MHGAFTGQIMPFDGELKVIMQLCPLEANLIPLTKIILIISNKKPSFYSFSFMYFNVTRLRFVALVCFSQIKVALEGLSFASPL